MYVGTKVVDKFRAKHINQERKESLHLVDYHMMENISECVSIFYSIFQHLIFYRYLYKFLYVQGGSI